jgi:hypothetical protein
MPLKATLKPDHIPVNKYEFAVVGLVPLTFTGISGIEEELDTTELPDRTRASGGNTKPGEFTARAPLHHTAEHTALEVWYNEGKDPVSSTYKKPVTLTMKSLTDGITRSYTLMGVFITGRGLPELEMSNEGEIAVVEWTFSYDSILPI